MRSRPCFAIMSILALIFGSLSLLVPTAGGQGSWVAMTDTPDSTYPVGMGGSLTYVGPDYIYAFQGHTSNETPQAGKFWRYSILGNTWIAMDDAPGEVAWGGALAWGGGPSIYALQGNGSNSFWSYSILGNSWTAMTNTPTSGVRWGGSLSWTGDDFIYAFRGDHTMSFWRYSMSTDAWAIMANAPDSVHAGGALAWGGGDYIYALRGNGTTDFWGYNVSTDSWETMHAAPGAVGEGGALTWVGGDYIFALQGAGTSNFWRYDVSTDNWEDMEATLAAVGAGGALCYADGHIFALRGNSSTNFWRFEHPCIGVQEKVTTPPAMFEFLQNSPNPFVFSTTISYLLPTESHVSLRIYSLNGQLVRTLVDARKEAGYHRVSWNGQDDGDKKVAVGVYFYKIQIHTGLETGNYTETAKMILLK